MTTAEYNLRFLKAGIDLLETYLLSNDIYRPIGVQPPGAAAPYPQLTLGWLLLYKLRAQAVSQNGAQRVELDRLTAKLEALRAHWRSTWAKKSRDEFRARLNLWRDFLAEYSKNPAANFDRYAYEVNRRALLHLLSSEAEDLPTADVEALNGLDKLLHTVFIPGDFIWDEVLIPSFPKSTFWFLYGSLKRAEAR